MAGDVALDGEDFRLVLSEEGFAKSLVVKSTGEECLAPGVRIPFAMILQGRPYDNEAHLMHPARPISFPSCRVARVGDSLEIGFAGEYHVLRLRVVSAGGYLAFVPEGTDYRITDDFGDKRRTEIDGVEFLRLPVASRARYGECANVAWDGSAAVAVMGTAPQVRIDGDVPEGVDGWRLFRAGTCASTGLFGGGAALFASPTGGFLDRVDAFERDFRLPRGVRNRRDPIMRAAYLFTGDIEPANVAEEIEWMKKGGFRVCMVSYRAFALACGHFEWKRDRYPGGLADLVKVCDALRAAGIVPALHFHYNKVSMRDPYVTDGLDGRMAVVRDLCLATELGADDDAASFEGNPSAMRHEDGRRIVRIGEEALSYERVEPGRPWRLLGLKRGLFGTKRARHPKGTRGALLDVDDWPQFIRVDQTTDIQDEIAARIAGIVDACGFRLLYFDGGEDVPPPYWHNVPLAQMRVWEKIKTEPRGAESALKSHFGWHMMSRGNAFDTFYPERTRQALDKYILPAASLAADDFSTVDFGWFGFFLPGTKTRKIASLADNNFAAVTAGTTPEQAEMVASAAYRCNAPISLMFTLKEYKKHPQADGIMAVFKKYEDMKFGGVDLLREPSRKEAGRR